jgi:hypothetical protein
VWDGNHGKWQSLANYGVSASPRWEETAEHGVWTGRKTLDLVDTSGNGTGNACKNPEVLEHREAYGLEDGKISSARGVFRRKMVQFHGPDPDRFAALEGDLEICCARTHFHAKVEGWNLGKARATSKGWGLKEGCRLGFLSNTNVFTKLV